MLLIYRGCAKKLEILMLVVALVFLTIGGVSAAVRSLTLCDDSCNYYDGTIMTMGSAIGSAVSISLSGLDSSPPLILVYLHQKGRKSGFLRLCIIYYIQ